MGCEGLSENIWLISELYYDASTSKVSGILDGNWVEGDCRFPIADCRFAFGALVLSTLAVTLTFSSNWQSAIGNRQWFVPDLVQISSVCYLMRLLNLPVCSP
jgi:hypothetical protein